LDAAAEKYEDLTALRAAVSLIPYVGGALDIMISGRAAHVHQERMTRWVNELRDAYGRLDEAAIDKDFLASDDFLDFFCDAAERYTRSHGEEKLEALRNAFVNGTTQEGCNGPLKEIVLRVEADLTADHMRALKALRDGERDYSPRDDDPADRIPYADIAAARVALASLDVSDTDHVVLDLESANLVDNWWRHRLNDRHWDRFVITDFGRRFIWFITHPADRTDDSYR